MFLTIIGFVCSFAASIDSHFNRPKINALNFITPSLSASSLLMFAVSSLSAEERTPVTIINTFTIDKSILKMNTFKSDNHKSF